MIALDAMGGDFSPHSNLQGALSAARKGIPVLLFGDAQILEKELTALDQDWRSLGLLIEHTSEEIAMDEEPAAAVRKKTDSSLVRAVRSVKEGRSSAVVSAGSSGALMIASLFILGRREGIERPAIAGILPTAKGVVVGLDLGANTECKPSYLYQFAHLGAEFVREHFHLEHPRVGLLSNGHEDCKGSALTKETFELLKQSTLNFVGNVEPYNIFAGDVDVFVTDGFSGNVLIKTLESVRDLVTLKIVNSDELPSGADNKMLGDIKSSIEKSFKNDDRGGAVLLGVQGRAIVCHGAAHGDDIERALMLAKGL